MKNLVLLFIFPFLFSACAGTQVQAWNHYEAGMLLAFQGYEVAEGTDDKVEKEFNTALEKNPELPGVNASLGTYRAKQGDVIGARGYWEREMTLHPESAIAMKIGIDRSEEFSQSTPEKERKTERAISEEASVEATQENDEAAENET